MELTLDYLYNRKSHEKYQKINFSHHYFFDTVFKLQKYAYTGRRKSNLFDVGKIQSNA